MDKVVNEDKEFPAKDPGAELPPFDEFEGGDKTDVTKEAPKDNKPEADVTDKPEKKANLAVQKERVPIPIGKAGFLVTSNDEQMFKVAVQLVRGRAIPKWFQTPEQVHAAMVILTRLGVPPETNLNCVANVEGTLSIFGDLPLDLVLSSKEFVSHEEYLFDKDYNKICFENKNVDAVYIGAVCIVQRKGQEKKSFTFTVEDAMKAGLWEKKSSSGSPMPWSLYPKIMLTRRARAWALKSIFPDVLKGVKIAEYDFNQAPDLKDVTPQNPSTDNYISAKYNSHASPGVAPNGTPGEAERPISEVIHSKVDAV